MKKKWLWIALGGLLVVVIAGLSIARGARGKVESVQLAKVRREDVTSRVRAPGKIEPKTQVKVSADIPGKVVILNFWSPSCGPCVKEIPSLNEAYRKMKGDGLVVLGIAVDPAAKAVADVVARLKVEYPNLIDPEKEVYFDSYGLFGQPVSVIVDRRGVVRDKIFGSVEWCSAAVRAKLQTYLNGR